MNPNKKFKYNFKQINKEELKMIKEKIKKDITNINNISSLTSKLLYKLDNLEQSNCKHNINEESFFSPYIVCNDCQKIIVKNFYKESKLDNDYNISQFLEYIEDCNLLINMSKNIMNEFKYNKEMFKIHTQKMCDHQWGQIERGFEPCGQTPKWQTCKICDLGKNL
uniref:Uncharacterized protein n=1 Tax=viral metagenome TaxID=1070528 RepID=A0A6C0AC26_9ZZZZ